MDSRGLDPETSSPACPCPGRGFHPYLECLPLFWTWFRSLAVIRVIPPRRHGMMSLLSGYSYKPASASKNVSSLSRTNPHHLLS